MITDYEFTASYAGCTVLLGEVLLLLSLPGLPGRVRLNAAVFHRFPEPAGSGLRLAPSVPRGTTDPWMNTYGEDVSRLQAPCLMDMYRTGFGPIQEFRS